MHDPAIGAVLQHMQERRAQFAGHNFDDAIGLKARDFLADTLAVGIAGRLEPAALQIRRAAENWGSGDAASVLGSEKKLPAPSAAFCNAFQIHCQEYDCLHEGATVHAMAVLGGCLTALANGHGLSYGDALLATIIGVDIAAGLGLAARQGLIFFRPATAGALGSACAIAACLDLNERQTMDLLGLVYSQLSGTMQAHIEGSVALPIQIGVAARAVISALDLVDTGLSGPHNVLSGPFGYFRLFEPDGKPEVFISGLSSAARVCELSHKPFPTGRAAHAILDGLDGLMRQHNLGSQDIVQIDAYIPPLIRRLVDRPIVENMSRNYARLCIYYLSAIMMRDGHITGQSFSAENLSDAALHALSQKLTLHDNDISDPNALAPQHLVLTTTSGDQYERSIPATLGHPDNPLSEAQKRRKISLCLEDHEGALSDVLLTGEADRPLADIMEAIKPAANASPHRH